MAGTMRVRRSRGALSGALLVLLGAWGGLVPFIGPYFHYAYSPDTPWSYTSGRLWLEILPGLLAMISGFIVLISTLRPAVLLGAWMAAISGAWFAVGGPLAVLWTHTGGPAQGVPMGGELARAVEQIGYFTGLGAAIMFIAGTALGRLSVRSARDMRITPAPPSGTTAPPDAADETATTVKTPIGRLVASLREREPAGSGAGSR